MAKILLVEDDNNLREIYEARLMAEGYEIMSARDGEEALKIATKERPDLIISDVMMPKISGFDMLDIIRATEETKDVKVIMMTALSQAEDKARAEKLGADRYLVKSQVTLEDVAKVAKEVLDGPSKAAATSAEPTPEETTPAVQPAPVATVPEPVVVAKDPTVTKPESEQKPEEPAPSTSEATPEPVVVAVTEKPQPPTQVETQQPTPEETTPAVQPAPVATVPEPVVIETPKPKPAPVETATPTTPTPVVVTTPPVTATPEPTLPASTTVVTADPPVSDDTTTSAPIATPSTDDVEEEKEATPAPVKTETPSTVITTEPAEAVTPEPVQTEKTKKKVIQPINDITASSKPKLEELMAKEEEKEAMLKAVDKAQEAVKTPQPEEHVHPEPTPEEPVTKPTEPVTEKLDPNSITL